MQKSDFYFEQTFIMLMRVIENSGGVYPLNLASC